MSDKPTSFLHDSLNLAYLPGKSIYRNIWYNFARYKGPFLIGSLLLLGTNYCAFEIPKFIGNSVALMRKGSLGETIQFDDITRYAIYIILFALAAGVTRILSRIFIFNAGRDIEFEIRNALYQKLTLLSPSYFSSIRTGDITSRVSNDVSNIRVLYAFSFLHLVNTIIAYIVGLQKMLTLNVTLTLICLAPFPILLFLIKYFVQTLFKHSINAQIKLSTISSQVQENLAGMPVVKTYRLEQSEIDLFRKESNEYIDVTMKMAKARGGLNATTLLVTGIGSFLALTAGGYMLQQGRITLAQFVMFNGYISALAFPTAAMGWFFSCLNRGLASYKRIFEVFEAPVVIHSPAEPTPLPKDIAEKGAISVRNVSFSYGKDLVLKNISFDVEAGTSVAIVGKTGSGKTTLAKLLTRLYDPQEGEIFFDGVNLRDLDLREMRSEIGVVSQEPFLFSMSLFHNICFGLDALEFDPTIDRKLPTTSLYHPEQHISNRERVEEAVDIAGLSSDINSFPDGLETIVGERGITLSGGQKQRTTIARALLVDPRLLILDDALSAIDTKTEAAILGHLHSVMQDRTSLLITHRFNALDRIDKIIVLDHGEIVDQGTHQELVNKPGIYQELWQKQQLSERLQSEESDKEIYPLQSELEREEIDQPSKGEE